MIDHIVWDWNGTLLGDVDAVVQATSDSFVAAGLPPVTVREYRAAYCRPIKRFYARLLGRELSDDEWRQLDAAFHDEYAARSTGCELADGAVGALRRWSGSGRTQSLLSMYGHDRLLPLVARHGVADYFTRVDGLRGVPGDRKAEYLVGHLAAQEIPAERVLVVGDSLDDAEAARHAGAQCVLYAYGFHDRRDLADAGVPVVDTLGAAVEVALSEVTPR